MEELLEYRARLVERYRDQPAALRAVVSSFRGDWHHALRPGEWSPHQLLVHVRDAEQQAYAPRLKRILVEDRPLFEDFDGDAFMTQHYRAGEDIRAILEAIEAERMALAERLRALASAEWSRTGRHPSLGERTLQSWVERSESHMQEHLTQLASYAG